MRTTGICSGPQFVCTLETVTHLNEKVAALSIVVDQMYHKVNQQALKSI